MSFSEHQSIRHYTPQLIDFVPIFGLLPHILRVRRYFKDFQSGVFNLPSNASLESMVRIGITAYHSIAGGIGAAYIYSSVETLIK